MYSGFPLNFCNVFKNVFPEHPFLIVSKNPRLSVCLNIVLPRDMSCRNPDLSLDTEQPNVLGDRVALRRMSASHRVDIVNSSGIVRINAYVYRCHINTEGFQTKEYSHECEAVNVIVCQSICLLFFSHS